MSNFIAKKYGENRFLYAEYNTLGIQETINVPYVKNGLTIQLTPVGGQANVQASNDGVNWEKWLAGDVVSTAINLAAPIRYLRVENISATSCTIAGWGF